MWISPQRSMPLSTWRLSSRQAISAAYQSKYRTEKRLVDADVGPLDATEEAFDVVRVHPAFVWYSLL